MFKMPKKSIWNGMWNGGNNEMKLCGYVCKRLLVTIGGKVLPEDGTDRYAL